MFKGLGAFASKFKFLIILFWVALAVFMVLYAPTLSETGKLDTSDFLPAGSESGKAAELIAQYFPQEASDASVTVIVHNPDGLNASDMAFSQSFSQWLSEQGISAGIETVTSIYTNPALASSLISPDNTTMLINIGLNLAESDKTTSAIIESLENYIEGNNSSSSLQVYVSGEAGIMNDLMTTLVDSVDITTIVTVILVIVLLLIIYRSPIAMLVPLLTIGTAYLISRGVLGYMGEWGINLWSQLDVFIIVLIFGVGTDYCLFLVSRYREELKRHSTRLDALRATGGSIGSVIAASAFAVIIGLAGLTVAEYGMLHTMGLALATAVFITLLAALTLTPALSALFGKFMFWPGYHADVSKSAAGEVKENAFWRGIAKLTTRYSFIVAFLIVALMAGACIPYFKMEKSYDTLAELSADSDSVKGFTILSEHFDIGNMMPATIILTTSGGSASSSAALGEIDDITAKILAVDGVSSVISVVSPDGSGQPLDQLTVVGQINILLAQLNSAVSGAEANPMALFGPETMQMFQFLGSYLGELGAAFPEVTAEPSYIAALTILNDMSAAMATVDLQKMDMATLAAVQAAFQQYITEFVQAMMGLGQYFAIHGNPYFIPQGLLALYPELGQLINTFISSEGDAVKLMVTLHDYPYSEAAMDTIQEIKDVIHNGDTYQYFNMNEAAVGGASSAMLDVRSVLETDFIRIMIVVLAGVFLVLCLLLRSFVAPLYIMAIVTFAYVATMGISTWLFSDILGHSGVSFAVPIIVFVLMISLGADYNIFMMSRIREEAHEKPMKEAIRSAIMNTGYVIMACGVILGGTFLAMLISPIQTMFQLGVAVAIGVFVETFVVIVFLLPAMATMFGRASWWPFGHKKLGIKRDQ
ncbi:MAG: MMPL family transporter [Dehalococcoidales bacterium]|nr:MMPL family transporter [Dehalococcoidales bacterium]